MFGVVSFGKLSSRPSVKPMLKDKVDSMLIKKTVPGPIGNMFNLQATSVRTRDMDV